MRSSREKQKNKKTWKTLACFFNIYHSSVKFVQTQGWQWEILVNQAGDIDQNPYIF